MQALMNKRVRYELSKVAPSIHFAVDWEVDPYFIWNGFGPDPRNKGYYPHDVTVTATAIINGDLVKGQNVLGGSYDKPGKLCRNVHGYLLQMIDEAIDDLRKKVGVTGLCLTCEMHKAQSLLKKLMTQAYNRQRKGKK